MNNKIPSISVPLTVPLDGSVSADRRILGGKGWGLQQMHQLGMPVPPAFTITTLACGQYFENDRKLSPALWDEVLEQVDSLERRTGTRLGGGPALLVSVRSGAPTSMPGMMDTLLNVGLAHSREHALRELRSAICRIFDSWNSDRARVYREANNIPDSLGTAVTVQAMVFGNADSNSGTGVYVTRNPISGDPSPFGEWLPQAQGEELVSGRCTPKLLTELLVAMPEVYEKLLSFGQRLERVRRNVLEIEFTVESGILYLLQVRDSSSSPIAAARWAVDFVRAGVIDIPEAISRIPIGEAPVRHIAGEIPVLAQGIGVSPGLRAGLVVSSVDEAEEFADQGHSVLLARPTTSTHDIQGFLVADGVITEHGNSTSHAAVVARQLGLPCVTGCGSGTVDRLRGQLITIDGSTGRVYAGDVTASTGYDSESDPFEILNRWRAEYGHD